MQNIWLHRYALIIAVLTALLFLSGTVVTTNEDRPFYAEGQSHVWFGVVAGSLLVGLILWLWRTKERAWLWRLAWLAGSIALVDGVVGASFDQPPAGVRILHSLLGQIFFSATIAIALMTSQAWQKRPEPIEKTGRLKFLAIATPAVVLLQVILGAAHRHGAMGLAMHLVWAMVVGLFLVPVMAIIFSIPEPRLRSAGIALSIVACSQILLGFGVFIMQSIDADPEALIVAASVHATIGALTLATTVVIALLVWRVSVQARSADPRPLSRRSEDTAARPALA